MVSTGDTRTGGKTGRGQNGGGSRPIDSKVAARIRKLARAGEMSRNKIAREVGVSPSTVSKVCAAARPPITFDRSASAAAVQAHVVDLKARRVELAALLLDDAYRLREEAWKPVTRTHMSVTNGEVKYETPMTPDERKNTYTALGIVVDKHVVLVKHDSDGQDLPAVDAWLAHLVGGTSLAGAA